MATQQTTIFNNNLVSNVENFSQEFFEGLGFYLINPNTNNEYQVDIFLQVKLSNTITRQIRLERLNISDTQKITLLPQQIVNLGLPMQLLILPSSNFFLEIILLKSSCTLCSLENKLNNIDKTLIKILNDLNLVTPPTTPPTSITPEQGFFFIN